MENFDIFGLLFHTKRYIVQLTVPKVFHEGSIVALKNIDSETKYIEFKHQVIIFIHKMYH